MRRVELYRGDITRLGVDAIVNAANSSLLGGGGVDGAIHRAAGPELADACRRIGRCPTGEARITGGFRLPAKYVIHTVGPVWRGGEHGEDLLLANCYRNSLALAAQHSVKSIAFPAISTGRYKYPLVESSRIAILEVVRHLEENASLQRVVFALFDEPAYFAYEEQLASLTPVQHQP